MALLPRSRSGKVPPPHVDPGIAESVGKTTHGILIGSSYRGGAPWQPVEKWESDSRQGGCSHPPIRTCLPFRADQTVHPTFSPARRRGLHRPVATVTMHEPSRISHGAFRLQNMAWLKKGVRYRCAKHPTNLRSVPGRPGNRTRPLFEPCLNKRGEYSRIIGHNRLFHLPCMPSVKRHGIGIVLSIPVYSRWSSIV